jgi:hypothetical protein
VLVGGLLCALAAAAAYFKYPIPREVARFSRDDRNSLKMPHFEPMG